MRTSLAWIGLALLAGALACGDDETSGGTPTGSGGQGQGGQGATAGSGGQGATGGSGGDTGSGGGLADACIAYPNNAEQFDVDGSPHCYWLQPTLGPQLAADDVCANDGGYLATITSQAENDHVQSLAAAAFPVWIGLRCDANPNGACIGNKAAYAWMNGDAVSYDGWAAGEPATPRGAAMHDTGEWYGYDSLNNSFAFVCEAAP